jgi:hypothetical protein
VDAAEYRAKAREMREKARTTHDPSAHADLLMMANQYDWLAKWIEARTPEQP